MILTSEMNNRLFTNLGQDEEQIPLELRGQSAEEMRLLLQAARLQQQQAAARNLLGLHRPVNGLSNLPPYGHNLLEMQQTYLSQSMPSLMGNLPIALQEGAWLGENLRRRLALGDAIRRQELTNILAAERLASQQQQHLQRIASASNVPFNQAMAAARLHLDAQQSMPNFPNSTALVMRSTTLPANTNSSPVPDVPKSLALNQDTSNSSVAQKADRDEDEINSVGSAGSSESAGLKEDAMPRRPLTAYNIFFRFERAKVLGLPLDFKIGGIRQEKKRPHRKTHGKIPFVELARHVSQKWKNLDQEKKAYFENLAKEELKTYKEAKAAYAQKHGEDISGNNSTRK